MGRDFNKKGSVSASKSKGRVSKDKPKGSRDRQRPSKDNKQRSSKDNKQRPSKDRGSSSKDKKRSFKNRDASSTGNEKQEKRSKSNFKKRQNNEETGEEENQNKLIEKNELLSKSCDEQIQILKDIHNKIILDPEENIKHLETMFALAKTPNLKIVCMALRVLSQTFISIAPLDSIDMRKLEERTEIKIKKEEYKVVRFQKNLVDQYERYIKMLKEMNAKAKLVNFNNDREIHAEFKKCLLECLIKCYRTLWNFNFAKQLNDLTLKFIKYEACREFLKEMLMEKNIAMIGIKAKIINGISKLIKQEQDEKRLPADIIKIINATHVDSRYLKKDQETYNYKKKQLKKKLYKQEAFETKKEKDKMKNAEKGSLEMKRLKKQEKLREKMKVREEVNKEFAEGESIIKNKELVRHNSNTLQELFYVYFKILVERMNSTLLKDCLDGVLKFVHLINIELTQSLIEHIHASAGVFREFWKASPNAEMLEFRLMVVFTGESIINGPLSVYNMDDTKMTTHLYKILKDVNKSSTLAPQKKKSASEKPFKISMELYRLICLNVEEAFVKRRQLSQEVVGSFMRELAIFLQRKEIPKLYITELIRTMAYRYNKVSRMFEADNEGFGMNSFNETCEDPQCSNAINTEIVSYLKNTAQSLGNYPKSYQQMLSSKIEKLIKQNFNQKDMGQTLESILKQEIEGGQFFSVTGVL